MYKLLIAGQSIELALPVLRLFQRAGAIIDFMSPSARLHGHPSIRRYLLIADIKDLPEQLMAYMQDEAYDRVIIADDVSLALIKYAELSEAFKLQILPITAIEACAHLASKIGLSVCLTAAGISTPAYQVIEDPHELPLACRQLGYPLLLKGDQSGGGTQVIKLEDDEDIAEVIRNFKHFPAVLQRYIKGELIGIEAYYQQESLVFFNYAKILSNVKSQEFTPSIFRNYLDNSSVGVPVYDDLSSLGRALRADGFVNITALYDPNTQQHFYVEADMRPTVWVDHAQYWKKDDALAIRLAIQNKTICPHVSDANPVNLTIAYPVRMGIIDLVFNRGLAWQQIRNEPYLMKLIMRHYRHQFLAVLNLRLVRQWCKKVWMSRKMAERRIGSL